MRKEESCNARTLKGRRCKRQRKQHIARWLCWQHWAMYKRDYTSVSKFYE